MAAPRLERYEILGEVGRGGMSVVYRALDRQLGRMVAVKVLHPHLAADLDHRRRLVREARAVARLAHPSVLEVFDSSDPEAEHAYLVTELVEGQTLRAWLEQHGPPLPELGALVVHALLGALRHAHERGVLHRDLKPENVMVTAQGGLKLMDFGIARILEGNTRLTATGSLLGSPAHMAPEIIDGLVPDHRSDVYSAGTILYWVLTGRLPFEAPNPAALFRNILDGRFEPVAMRAPAVGNGLARVVERALERIPDARFPDVAAFERDLGAEVEAAGFDTDPVALAAVLLDPSGRSTELKPALVDRLLAEGRAAAKDRSRAVDRARRVLAYVPEHPEAAALLRRATRSPPRRAPVAAAGAGLLLLAAGATWVKRMEVVEEPSGRSAVPGLDFPGLDFPGLDFPEAGGPPEPAERPTLADGAQRAGSASASEPSPRQTPPPGSGPSGRSAKSARAVSARIPIDGRERGPVERQTGPARPRTTPDREPAPPPDEGPPPDLEASSAPEQAPSEPKTALLRIRIGQSYAHIRLDGKTRVRDGYQGELRLDPGVHQVEVVKPGLGRFAPRAVEVTPEGELFEQLPGGQRRALVDGVLDFRVPLSTEEAARTPGWAPG